MLGLRWTLLSFPHSQLSADCQKKKNEQRGELAKLTFITSHSISMPILVGQINLTEQILDLSFFLKEKGTVSVLLYSL